MTDFLESFKITPQDYTRDCGAIDDVDCAVGHTPCLSASNANGYTIDEAEVIYWGLCPACA